MPPSVHPVSTQYVCSDLHAFLVGCRFSGVFTNHSVLQRGASTQAGVYGTVEGAAASTTVQVTVSEQGKPSYTVDARVVDYVLGGTNLTWHALLKPHPDAGGNVTLTARCAGYVPGACRILQSLVCA